MVRLEREVEGRGYDISDQQWFMNAQSKERCGEMGRGRERKKKNQKAHGAGKISERRRREKGR